MTKKRIAALALMLAGAALALTGCGNHGSDNASTIQPTGPASVIQFPTGFRNIAYKCDGRNMVYSVSAGADDSLSGGVAVVANDPRCVKPTPEPTPTTPPTTRPTVPPTTPATSAPTPTAPETVPPIG